MRRLAPALTSGVDFTILFAALAVLLGIESGAEDMAAALWSADFASRRRPVDRNEEARTSLIVLRVYAARRRNRWSLVANGLVGSSVRFGKIARGIPAVLLNLPLVTTLQLRPRRRHITRWREAEVAVERGGRAP